jgi:hypothetical protein
MAKDCSFDVASNVDLNILNEAINVAMKEIDNRFDFKGSGAEINLDQKEKTVIFLGASDFQIEQIKDILTSKMIKRNISPKALSFKKKENASGDKVREFNNVVCGIDKELAKKIVADIKNVGVKVQSSIQDEKVRVSGKDKDDLQAVIQFLRAKEYPVALQFENFR